MVYEMFRDNNFSPTVSRILTQLTTYKGKLPQGAPTSPIIANLVFIKTGKRLDSFAKENRLTFTTYQDDIYFSSPVDFKILTGRIIELIRADGYLISHKKTYYKTKNPIVTGLIVKNNRLAVKNSFLLKLKDVANKRPEQIQGLKNYLYKIEKLNKSR